MKVDFRSLKHRRMIKHMRYLHHKHLVNVLMTLLKKRRGHLNTKNVYGLNNNDYQTDHFPCC
jgi:hypothetical protein